MVTIDVGGELVASRVTTAATRELGLACGMPVWALVQAVALSGQAF
jgi:ABC-type molybdate transport system ATPase subunit